MILFLETRQYFLINKQYLRIESIFLSHKVFMFILSLSELCSKLVIFLFHFTILLFQFSLPFNQTLNLLPKKVSHSLFIVFPKLLNQQRLPLQTLLLKRQLKTHPSLRLLPPPDVLLNLLHMHQ